MPNSDDLIASGSLGGTFAVVIWLVRVLVSRSRDVESASASALSAARAEQAAQVRAAIEAEGRRCDERIDALRLHTAGIVNAVRVTAATYPGNEPLQMLASLVDAASHPDDPKWTPT